MTMNRGLIVVRAGDFSLHSAWVKRDRKLRSYDVALSYFGNFPEYWKTQCDFFFAQKGSKWQGLSIFVKEQEELITQYDYVWFPDDDLWMHPEEVEDFFNLCRTYQIDVAQPALQRGSFYSWKITLQNDFTIFRETNFVEVMAPCFKVANFNFFKDTFKENTSGWGLEYLWWKIAKDNNCNKFAIMDQTPMLHTREVGTAGSGGATLLPRQEMEQLLEKYHLSQVRPKVLKKHFGLMCSFPRFVWNCKGFKQLQRGKSFSQKFQGKRY